MDDITRPMPSPQSLPQSAVTPPQPAKPWYRETNGKIFLGCLGILLLGTIVFGSLIGYYLWQIKYGDREAIEESFRQEKFTLDSRGQLRTPAGVPATDLADLLRPGNPTLGRADATVTVFAFLDFECPFCQESYPAFEYLRAQYEPVVRIVFKHVPLTSIHPQSLKAHEAAACAHEQGAFWPYYAWLFEKKKLDETSLVRAATDTRLNLDTFTACLAAGKYRATIETDLRDAARIGIRGTPTYIVNGKKFEGVVDEKTWDAIMIEALGAVGTSAP